MTNHVTMRLDFARRRMEELLALNNGDLLGASEYDRQQLIQEFFFHLVGAIDSVAQHANERRKLGMNSEDVSVSKVISRLPTGDQLIPKLQALYTRTRGQPLPTNPYSDDGYLFRIYNYRNQVAHRGRNPWNFNIGSQPGPNGVYTAGSITLQLDPRGPNRIPSNKPVRDELTRMLDIVTTRVTEAMKLLP